MAYSKHTSLALHALMWSFQLTSLSTITPRNFVDFVCCITWKSIDTGNAISGGSFDFVNNINFLLDLFKDSLLVINQLKIILKSLLTASGR